MKSTTSIAIAEAAAQQYRIDKRLARKRSGGAITTFEQARAIPEEIAQRLAEHLDPITIQPHTILELGAGNAVFTDHLAQRYPRAALIALDHALPSLLPLRPRWIRWLERRRPLCADAEQLPLSAQSIGLVASNLLLHWCNDIGQMVDEWARVLAPGGLTLFSTYGPDTLSELRESFAQARGAPTSPQTIHVHAFADMHQIGDELQSRGFEDVVMESERITVEYRDLNTLFGRLTRPGRYQCR